MTEVPPPPPREPSGPTSSESLGTYRGPTLGPPPTPPGGPAADEPGDQTDPTTKQRPRWLIPTIAAVAGLIVGAAVTSAVVGLTAEDDDNDDVGQACAIVSRFDPDTFEGDADRAFDDPRDLYRASAAANLFFAANNGEFEGELGDIGQGLQIGFQTFNPESAKKGLDDARAYCDDR